MKKIYLVVPLVGLMATAAYAAAPSSLASGGGVNTKQYHSYDGLICTDCHTLHASEDGANVDGRSGWTGGVGYNNLLKKGDWTDMCLSCHKQGFNTAATADLPGVEVNGAGWTAPIVMTQGGVIPEGVSMPAGDFWQSNDNPKRGHNPVYTLDPAAKAAGTAPSTATSKIMNTRDTVLNANPPGGAIKDGEWSCHSCHGMHARFSGGYTAYRQIKRKVNGIVHTADVSSFGVENAAGDYPTSAQAAGFEPIKSNTRGDLGTTGLVFSATRKDGIEPLDGADLYQKEGDNNKNVYRGGFSSFCATCHGDFHSGDTTGAMDATKAKQSANVRAEGAWIKHPTDLILGANGGIVAKYGIQGSRKGGYNVTVTNSVGTDANPAGYDWKYPLVVSDGNTGGVSASSASALTATTLEGTERIMCLTCHKAHASQFENMTRWDTNQHSFLANNATDFTGEVNNKGDNPAYGCGKCHQKGGAKAFK